MTHISTTSTASLASAGNLFPNHFASTQILSDVTREQPLLPQTIPLSGRHGCHFVILDAPHRGSAGVAAHTRRAGAFGGEGFERMVWLQGRALSQLPRGTAAERGAVERHCRTRRQRDRRGR